MLVYEVSQIGTNWGKFGTFSTNQNVLNLIGKSPIFFPFRVNLTHFGAANETSLLKRELPGPGLVAMLAKKELNWNFGYYYFFVIRCDTNPKLYKFNICRPIIFSSSYLTTFLPNWQPCLHTWYAFNSSTVGSRPFRLKCCLSCVESWKSSSWMLGSERLCDLGQFLGTDGCVLC